MQLADAHEMAQDIAQDIERRYNPVVDREVRDVVRVLVAALEGLLQVEKGVLALRQELRAHVAEGGSCNVE